MGKVGVEAALGRRPRRRARTGGCGGALEREAAAMLGGQSRRRAGQRRLQEAGCVGWRCGVYRAIVGRCVVGGAQVGCPDRVYNRDKKVIRRGCAE